MSYLMVYNKFKWALEISEGTYNDCDACFSVQMESAVEKNKYKLIYC